MNYFNEAPTGPAGRSSIDPVEFGDPVTAKLRYEIIPPGGFQEVFYDNFSTDTLADVARYPEGAGTHSIVNGSAMSSAANAALIAGPPLDQKRVSGKQTMTGNNKSATNGGILIARAADGWKLVFQYTYLNLVEPGGFKTQLGVSMGADTIWNRITKQGALITREGFNTDPRLGAAPVVTTTYNLSTTDTTRFAGVLPAGIWNQVASTTDGMDEVTVEKVLGEQRRLVADIDHPAGGVTSTVIASA
jgi:hypothetical protein